MGIKAAVLIITAFGILAISAAYVQRGYWAVGAEWALPVVMAMIIPLKGENDEKNAQSGHRREA